MTDLPLAGVRVLDFTTLLPGPLATLMLAQAGAEVIKVERPGGEEMRGYAPSWGDISATFAMLNRGKKSVAVDLKNEAARERMRDLAARCDVVVEQFRPGVMDRLGLGYETLRARNPRLIYCAITGYGQTGPRRERAGHDLNYIGDAGLLALSSGAPGHRTLPPGLIADIAGGAYPAVMNILLALRQRDASGEGTFLDVAMTENVLPFAFWALANANAADTWPRDGGERLTGGSPRYHIYETKDGKLATVAALEQKFWLAFTQAIGLDAELIDDRRDPQRTIARVAEIIASRTADEWRRVFDAADCCCSIVQDFRAAVSDAHFAERRIFAHTVTNARGDVIPALPLPLANALQRQDGESVSAPQPGAHNAEFGF
jgi:crotonobetainyl-CoA:carnitine CoA-transferase CaiB-like acyl-CoA transferase